MSTLKKIKANQSETSKKQMGDIAHHVEVPTEINENEKHLYHVLIIEAKFNSTTLKASYKKRLQTYDFKSWLSVKDRLRQIGVSHVYIIHNPTIEEAKAVVKETAKKEPKKEVKIEAVKTKRQKLIEEAKALGYEGALNVKNVILEEFITNAKENGEGEAREEQVNEGGEKEEEGREG